MTVGIIGTGPMGRALARAVASKVGPVLLTSPRPTTGQLIPQSPPFPPRCWLAQPDEIWRQARLVMLALPFRVALELISGGAGRLGDGRTLVDVSNPGLAPDAAVPPARSGGELIAEAAPTWSVAKAFNTVPAGLMEAHQMHGRPVSVPVAGSEPAKSEVFELARRLGFDPVDAGGIVASRELESLAMLLVRVSAAHDLRGRIAIHIGQPEPASAGGR